MIITLKNGSDEIFAALFRHTFLFLISFSSNPFPPTVPRGEALMPKCVTNNYSTWKSLLDPGATFN